jgi:AraC-like DNA-binding protein
MVSSRGHLNPGSDGVSFDRFAIGLDALVRHVWVVRWDLPDGQRRPQRVLTYPACNVVISSQDAFLYGPDPTISIRELSGRSWVVGILLRPAAGRILTHAPADALVASREPLPDAPHRDVTDVMSTGAAPADVADILRGWLAPLADQVDESGHAINEICRIAEERDDVVRVAELATLMGMTPRTLSRLTRHQIGVTPKWLIECRRLQRAATTLFTQPDTDLATLARALGYADQAHFTRRYRDVLGETPDQTRRAGAARSAIAGTR